MLSAYVGLTFLSYWDMNNLYGWAQSLALPYDRFIWLGHQEINELEDLLKNEIDLVYKKYRQS